MPDVDWTPDPVARAREALEGVTPGPWAQAPWHDRTILPKAWADDPDEVPPENRGPFSTIYAQHKADARFIAWARTGVPDLIAYADAQAAELERLRRMADNLRRDASRLTRDLAAARAEVERWRRWALEWGPCSTVEEMVGLVADAEGAEDMLRRGLTP